MSHLKLGVDVISAHNLMPKDGQGSSSSSVELYFDGQRFRTTIKEKDLNPVWNESFYINIADPSDLYNLTLDVSIYNYVKGAHSCSFLGKVCLNGASFVPYSDAIVLHYALQKRSIFSRVRGEIGLKVYITDDPSIKSSIPLPAVETIPNHEASVNHGVTPAVMNTIPSTVAHEKSETRCTFHLLPNPSHPQQQHHSSDPAESNAEGMVSSEEQNEKQKDKRGRKSKKSKNSVNKGKRDEEPTKDWVSRVFYQQHPHSSAPVVSHHATKHGVDEMKPEPQPPQLVRMYSVSSSLPVDYALKETSPVLEGERAVGGRVNRAAAFLVQSWHQASSTIKILLLFTSMGFHEILFPLLTWFWHLLFRVTSFQLLWVHDEKQEVPNMIRLKLMIDKESNRVLYAESDQDFVDILFSFLTLPMGTIIRLAEKRSGIGCMDNLYKSVENLDDKFLQTKACRTMLLKPKNAYEVLCKNLVLKIDDTDPAKHYTCSKFVCWGELQNDYRQPSFRLASAVKNSECICGRAMDKKVFLEHLQQGISKGKNVFVKETQSFVIADDLCITPSSMSDCHEMVQNLRVGNGESIEVMVITIGKEEVLQLLKNSFLSKTPMTDTFLLKEQDVDDDMQLFETQNNLVNPNGIPTNLIKPTGSFAMMKVKLLIDKTSDRVLCLEAEEDFLDIVLSFLTFPLGYMLKILRGHSCSLRSMDNLCRSVRQLDEKYLKLSKYRDMLLNPSLAPYFSCENQVLVMGEETSAVFTDHKCSNSLCSSSRYKKLRMMNPKLPGQVTRGGGFVKTPSSLLIYDDLVIRPCSPTSGILDLLGNNVRMSDTEIQEVEVGGKEVLALLVVSLTSKRVLNSVFRSRN